MIQKHWLRKLLYTLILLIVISPLFYLISGIGQQAEMLSAVPPQVADGIESSPKAEALHQLALPLRLQLLLTYPLLLLLVQYSGLVVSIRHRLVQWAIAPLAQKRGYKVVDGWVAYFTKSRLTLAEIAENTLYIGIFFLAAGLIFFPLSLYRGFILRHQFGLSTQTLVAWLRDYGLNQTINLLMTLVVYGGFYALLKLMPRRWPVWGGAAFTVLFLGFILLQPVVITPMFYQVMLLDDTDLQTRIEIMANRADMVIDDVSIIDASSKTTTINAYVTGFGRATKVVLWDTLLIKHPPDEVDVVLAHEMAHWYYRHTLVMILVSIGGVWIGLFALRFWLNRIWQKMGWRGPYDIAGYPYLLSLIAIAGIVSLPFVNGVSRFAENQADAFAIEVSQKPEAAQQLFERFAAENLSLVHVPAWEKLIFYTHPPLSERIERAKQAQRKAKEK